MAQLQVNMRSAPSARSEEIADAVVTDIPHSVASRRRKVHSVDIDLAEVHQDADDEDTVQKSVYVQNFCC